MKLKTFNKTNAASLHTGKPSIHFHRGGMMTLNRAACDLIKLKAGSNFQLHQDEENPEDWFIDLSKNPDAFVVRIKDESKGSACIQCSTIVKELLKSINNEDAKSVTCSIAEEPIKNGGGAIVASHHIVG